MKKIYIQPDTRRVTSCFESHLLVGTDPNRKVNGGPFKGDLIGVLDENVNPPSPTNGQEKDSPVRSKAWEGVSDWDDFGW